MAQETTDKLYLVTLKGMRGSLVRSIAYGENYVVAKDPTDAYNKVRTYLDENNIGYKSEREMDSITLLAENYRHTKVGILLFS